MAANVRLQGTASLSIHFAGLVDTEGKAPIGIDAAELISFATGTGNDASTADMLYHDRIDFTASQVAADAIDLRALTLAGNAQVMVRPKYFYAFYLEGEGTAFFDQGAANGYTGFSASGHSISKDRPFCAIPLTVSTGAADKTIAISETAGATVSILVVIVGTSA